MSEAYLGQIQMFGFNFAPRGWSTCDGQLLSISQFSAVFSLLGTTFGGDGETTFGLPELRGRSALHVGKGPGINNVIWGQKGGANTHTMTIAQMANHTHPVVPRGSNQVGGDETASAAGGVLTGNFGSDGRHVDPDLVDGTESQDAQLDSFVGLDADGDWVLFVADLSGGDENVLVDWSMEITGIPEPGTGVLALLGGLLLLRRKR